MSGGLPALGARIGAVSESSTTRVFALAQELRRQGRDIISLAVGEPDFETPAGVIAATRAALENGETRYGPVAGLHDLRSALAGQFAGAGPENIIVTNGAKQALFTLFHVLCDGDDEIILPSPCWVSFSEQIKLAGGVPVTVPSRPDHQLDLDAVEAAVTPRTKAIVINTPNNPTGAVYPREDLQAAERIAHRHGLLLVADEAYHAFTYNGAVHVELTRVARDPRRVVTIRSFSKQYNMTGFRLGYAAASAEIIAAMAKHQGHLCGNVCSFAQHGALAALELDPSGIEQCRTVLDRRRRLALGLVTERFDCVPPQGAFYLFPDVRRHLKKEETSEAFALRLLHRCGVAVVPGEAFGGPGHIRISFGAEETQLQEAFERMKRVL